MCKTIQLKVKFQAPPLTIYNLLAKAEGLRAVTGKPAKVEEVIGGRFSSYGGSVNGIIVDLLPGKRIVQAWREKSFAEGIFSMATFNLEPTRDEGTQLTLTHRGVPKDLIPRISTEWREHYWDRIKAFLSNNR